MLRARWKYACFVVVVMLYWVASLPQTPPSEDYSQLLEKATEEIEDITGPLNVKETSELV